MKESKNGIGFKYAWAGLITAFKTEKNFRIHLMIGLFILIVSYLLKINKYEWLIIFMSITFVIITELINSIIERLIDYIKPEENINAKEIKDMSAGFVLIAALFAIIMGSIIFLPKIIEILL